MSDDHGVDIAELKEFMTSVGLTTDSNTASAQKKGKGKKKVKSSEKTDQSGADGNRKVKLAKSKKSGQGNNTAKGFDKNDKKSHQKGSKHVKQPSAKIDFGDNADDDDSFSHTQQRPVRPRLSSFKDEGTFTTTNVPKKAEVAAIRKRMRLEPLPTWYEQEGTSAKRTVAPDLTESNAYQREAANYMVDETTLSEELHTLENGGEEAWMKTILKDGTFGDKLAAWMIRVQETPVHRLKALDALLTFARKKKREALEATETLKDLWLINLLPDRKLVRFSERPFDKLPEKQKEKEGLLILWHYEAELKARYQEYVAQIQKLAQEPQAGVRSKALGTIYDLLSQKPEQEQALLAMLCNKLGDPDKKVSAKARFLLTRLNKEHPQMKAVVAREVQHVLNRPNIGERARYNCICYLNQMELNRSAAGTALAKWLIETYFTFFEIVAKGKEKELESKMLSALLMGINRAHPFAKLDSVFFEKYSASLFKIIHSNSFNCSVQALLLLCQVLESSQAVSDRFFRALYDKMLDPELLTSSKQAMFLNVVYRSMKIDPSSTRVKSFAKRLLQVCVRQNPGFICGALYLLSEVIKKKRGLLALIEQPEDVDNGDETFVDAKDSDDDDSEEENFVDAKDSDDDEDEEKIEEKQDNAAKDVATKSAKTSDESDNDDDETNTTNAEDSDKDASNPKTSKNLKHPKPSAPKIAGMSVGNVYDMKKREPLYANADLTCLWELNQFMDHYHPSVSSFCKTLLNGKSIVYNGDPLRDFTIMRFLEKFVFKKPKKSESDKGGSLMQPKVRGQRSVEALNNAAFWNQNPENVAEDERFYLKYFKQKAKNEKNGDAQKLDGERDLVAAEDDEDDDGDEGDSERGGTEQATLDDFKASDGGQFKGDDDDDDDDDEDPYANMDADDMFDSDNENEPEMLDLEAIAREGFGEDDSDGEQEGGGSVFASAEEFSHLLEEGSTVSSAERKQAKWDNRGASSKRNNPNKSGQDAKKRKKGK